MSVQIVPAYGTGEDYIITGNELDAGDLVADSVDTSELKNASVTPGKIGVGTFTFDGVITPLVSGGGSATSDLSLKTTTGIGTTGADMHFLVGNNGATEAMTILNSGYVGIGTTAPATLVHGLLEDSGTNAVVNVLTLGHDSSGTPTTSFGLGINMQLETSTTAAQNAASITTAWTDATHATRTSKLTFNTVNSAAALAPVMTLTGTGRVGIGTITPSTLVHGILSSATTNAVVNAVTIGHNSTGTAG